VPMRGHKQLHRGALLWLWRVATTIKERHHQGARGHGGLVESRLRLSDTQISALGCPTRIRCGFLPLINNTTDAPPNCSGDFAPISTGLFYGGKVRNTAISHLGKHPSTRNLLTSYSNPARVTLCQSGIHLRASYSKYTGMT